MNSTDKRSPLRIHILGKTLVVNTDADIHYMDKLVLHVESVARSINKTFLNYDETSYALLTCILLADKLHKQQEEKDKLLKEVPLMNEKIQELIEYIDETLQK